MSGKVSGYSAARRTNMLMAMLSLFFPWFNVSASAQTTVHWTGAANGQTFQCQHPNTGQVLQYSWPDNDFWQQEERIGNDPCGNTVVLAPSNWSTPHYPGQGGNEDVVIGPPSSSASPTAINVDVAIHGLTLMRGAELKVRPDSQMEMGAGGVVNDGMIALESNVLRASSIDFQDKANLSGTGTIVLNIHTSLSAEPGVSVTHGAGHTIRGYGRISVPLVNNGVIQSDTGGGLAIRGGPHTNNALIRAVGADLSLSHITMMQHPANGRIVADGATVTLSTATIENGRLESTAGGRFLTFDQTVLSDVTSSADVEVVTGRYLKIGGGGLTNHGTLTLDHVVFSSARVSLPDGGVLDGTGQLLLNGTSSQIVPPSPGASFMQAAGHTIHGRGHINVDLINEGRLEGASSSQLLQVDGRLSGSGPLQDVEINRIHSPGTSTAVVSLEDTYTLASQARLEIEIAGTTAGVQFDQLDSTGTIDLGGTLDVSILDGYIPTPGDTYTIIQSTNPINGTFAEEDLPANIPNYAIDWDFQQNATDVTLQVLNVTALPGDYNADGAVDAADYTVWRDTLQGTGAGLAADGNGNGTIDPGDYNVWKASYGTTAPGTGTGAVAAMAPIPEPNSVALCLMWFVTVLSTTTIRKAQRATLREGCHIVGAGSEEGRMMGGQNDGVKAQRMNRRQRIGQCAQSDSHLTDPRCRWESYCHSFGTDY